MDSSISPPTAIRDRRLVSITLLSSLFLYLKSSIERIRAGVGWGREGEREGDGHYKCPSESPCRTRIFDLLTHLGVISNTSLTCHLPFNPYIQLPKERGGEYTRLSWVGNLGNWAIPVLVWEKPRLTRTAVKHLTLLQARSCLRHVSGCGVCRPLPSQVCKGSADSRKWRNPSILTTGFGTRP